MNFIESSISMFYDLLTNEVLVWALIACGLAQVSKLFFEVFKNGKWRPAVLIETGGMPSSHSALVSGTAAGIGLKLGFNDPVFSLAAVIAFIVMYDASGIRRSAGITAATVNKLVKETDQDPLNPLKESLGHTRLEVLVGSIFGPTVALIGIVYIGSPVDLFQTLKFALA
ncbi:divergent PAP2 family protein [Prochlorococcus sp. MIT 1223]|uniref:divergent PAP2 family protein n=1 Tax=Prochlorococcus sp. MIT 1223 TaxID=3096217 RepID=UPI002A761170|nr:divergent PAP2 family protein [Prochlorococcus sp. MIT 1223]